MGLRQNEEICDYILTAYCLGVVWKQSEWNCYFSGQSERIWHFLRPDGQFEQILTFLVYACCNPNIFGEIFEILSVHKTEIFGNFHLASSPIIGGPAWWEWHGNVWTSSKFAKSNSDKWHVTSLPHLATSLLAQISKLTLFWHTTILNLDPSTPFYWNLSGPP